MRILDGAVPEALERLHEAYGQLSPPLHLYQKTLGDRATATLMVEQRTGKNVRGDDAVLYSQVYAHANRRGHDMRRVAKR